jgi:hypothetical protein
MMITVSHTSHFFILGCPNEENLRAKRVEYAGTNLLKEVAVFPWQKLTLEGTR